MIKICFISTVFITIETFVLDLAKYLNESKEFDVSIICNADDGFTNKIPEGIHFFNIKMSRGINLDGLCAVDKLVKNFRSNKYDIVQYSTPNASFYASLAAKFAKIPVRLYCQWGIAYVGFSGIKRKIFRLIEKKVCKLSTVIEPDSYGNLYFSNEENLYSTDKGHVIWNGSASGVNLSKFDINQKTKWRNEIRKQLNILDDDISVVFVGRFTRDKGVVELLQVARKMVAENKKTVFLIVGNIENTDAIPSDLYQWSLNNPKIKYCGFSTQVEKYLSAADIFVLPSYREGFGSSVIEAESMGLPAVITNIPGLTDSIQKDETGIIVKKADDESLYHGLELLVNDSDLREKMGKKALLYATSNFNQKTLFAKIKEDRVNLYKCK